MSSAERVGTAIVFKGKARLLEAASKANDSNAMVPRLNLAPWEQEVRDNEGRRRFHGAFTGGFSAGYYNTVGSAEGWAPSQFVSSRKARADVRQQRPEDFMDEDDDPMLGRKLAARDEFDTLGARAAARASSTAVAVAAGPSHIPGPLPGELVVPSAAPIGKKLLRCMGWREGQGLGPRAARQRSKRKKERARKKAAQAAADAAKAAAAAAAGTAGPDDASDVDSDATPPRNNAKRVYGVTLPPHLAAQRVAQSIAGAATGGSDDSDSDDPYAQGILFAPKNTRVVRVVQKDNLYGLGFDPHVNAPEFRRASTSLALTNTGDGEGGGRAIIRMDAVFKAGGGARAGGGPGDHIRALEEDGDVYGGGTGMEAYDIELPTPEEERAKRNSRRMLTDTAGASAADQRRDSLTKSAVTGRCFDGRRPLPGFVLATHATTAVKAFKPLRVPRDYRPVKRFAAPGPLEAGAAARVPRDPVAAAAALAAAAVQAARDGTSRGSGSGSGSGHVILPGAGLAPGLNFTSAQRGQLLGEQGLNIPAPLQPDLRTEWQQRRQQREEAERHRSKVADRANAAIANRFVSKAVVGGGKGDSAASAPVAAAGGLKSVPYGPGLTTGHAVQQLAKQATAATPAGPSVARDLVKRPDPRRSEFEWAPERLLCKRFNVPDPYKGRERPPEADQPQSAAFQNQIMSLIPASTAANDGGAPAGLHSGAGGGGVSTHASKAGMLAIVDEGGAAGAGTNTGAAPAAGTERPPIDLFKAIFEPSSGEDDSSDSDSDAGAGGAGAGGAGAGAGTAARASGDSAPPSAAGGLSMGGTLGTQQADVGASAGAQRVSGRVSSRWDAAGVQGHMAGAAPPAPVSQPYSGAGGTDPYPPGLPPGFAPPPGLHSHGNIWAPASGQDGGGARHDQQGPGREAYRRDGGRDQRSDDGGRHRHKHGSERRRDSRERERKHKSRDHDRDRDRSRRHRRRSSEDRGGRGGGGGGDGSGDQLESKQRHNDQEEGRSRHRSKHRSHRDKHKHKHKRSKDSGRRH